MPVRHRFSEQAGPSEAHLRLIAFTDLHMRLTPYDYVTDRPVIGQSLALAAITADAARRAADNALTVDLGDAYEGSPVDADLFARADRDGHPMARALLAAGVEAATLGNHDFNYGLAEIQRVFRGPTPPTVLANLVRARGDTPLQDTHLLPPVTLLERPLLCGDGTRRTARIGVIGVAPPQTIDWDKERLGGSLVARDIVPTVAAWAPELRRRGADLVVVLCHSGIGAAAETPEMENAAVPVAALEHVDVVLAGHTHGQFPGTEFAVAPDGEGIVDPVAGRLHGKPCAMPGFWGNSIGVVDLRLRSDDEGGWTLIDSESSLRRVDATAAHPKVAEVTAAYHATVLSAVGTPVAQSRIRLHTYFAQIADAPAVQIVNAAQAAHAAARLKGTPEGALTLLSASAPLKAGGRQGPDHYTDVPAGPLTLRHVVDLHVYQNTIATLRLTGAELRAWLERSASVFNRIPAGARDTPLLDPEHPGYSFDVVSGVTYRITLDRPPLYDAAGRRQPGPGRIADLRCHGQPVAETDTFVLVTNSYRMGGGGGFPRPEGAEIPLGPPASVRDVLGAYLADGGADDAYSAQNPSWGFVPQPGTTAVFETGRGAETVPLPGQEAEAGPPLTPLGLTDAGTMLYRFDLSRAAALGPR